MKDFVVMVVYTQNTSILHMNGLLEGGDFVQEEQRCYKGKEKKKIHVENVHYHIESYIMEEKKKITNADNMCYWVFPS